MTPRRAFLLAGLVVTLLLAGVVSGFASGQPDGLEKVAADQGFAAAAREHPLGGSPVADYTVRGVDDERLGTGVAGVVGVAVTLALTAGVFALLRWRGRSRPRDPEACSS